MPRQNNYQLNEVEERAICKAMKSPKAKVMRRATILYNLHLGRSPQEVAEANQVSLSTVYSVSKRYREAGLEGIQAKAIPGRPPSLSEAQCKRLEEVLVSDPRELGYGFSIWTGQRLQRYLEEHEGIRVAEETIRNTLKRMGYVYRRPKKSLKHVQDEAQVERFKDLLQELKKEHERVSLSSCLWMRVGLNSTTPFDPAG